MTTKLMTQEEFNKLSINEKRVAIAKDVIIRINNGNFIEARGHIFQGEIEDYKYSDKLDPKTAINTKKCEVCARGALLCSWIGNFNNVDWTALDKIGGGFGKSYNSEHFPPQLLEVFDKVMLDNIEAAFESSSYDWHYDTTKTIAYECAFEREIDGEVVGAPIIELMEWIIKHEGEFPLPD
jgi:hypothetical protein